MYSGTWSTSGRLVVGCWNVRVTNSTSDRFESGSGRTGNSVSGRRKARLTTQSPFPLCVCAFFVSFVSVSVAFCLPCFFFVVDGGRAFSLLVFVSCPFGAVSLLEPLNRCHCVKLAVSWIEACERRHHASAEGRTQGQGPEGPLKGHHRATTFSVACR